ncbi:hypothetical protein V6Z12_D03G127800 [Gossypium hirsutum]
MEKKHISRIVMEKMETMSSQFKYRSGVIESSLPAKIKSWIEQPCLLFSPKYDGSIRSFYSKFGQEDDKNIKKQASMF